MRVFFKDESEQNFNPDLEFQPHLLDIVENTPIFFEHQIPLNTSSVQGLIGSDRLLAAFAAFCLEQTNLVVVSLGTATTIDFVSQDKVFHSGIIAPGLDSSFDGLINKASYLPSLDQLEPSHELFSHNLTQAMGNGLFIGHVAMIEFFYKQICSIHTTQCHLILTGGRAHTLSPFFSLPHKIYDNLVARGLTFI